MRRRHTRSDCAYTGPLVPYDSTPCDLAGNLTSDVSRLIQSHHFLSVKETIPWTGQWYRVGASTAGLLGLRRQRGRIRSGCLEAAGRSLACESGIDELRWVWAAVDGDKDRVVRRESTHLVGERVVVSDVGFCLGSVVLDHPGKRVETILSQLGPGFQAGGPRRTSSLPSRRPPQSGASPGAFSRR